MTTVRCGLHRSWLQGSQRRAPSALVGASDRGGLHVLALCIPADVARPVTQRVLRLTASELSDATGGGLLEDALIADVDGAVARSPWMGTGRRNVSEPGFG
jgi:hypothetical protein